MDEQVTAQGFKADDIPPKGGGRERRVAEA
jgi:hypothetical protein